MEALMERDDTQLIHSILSGDEDAFSELVRKYEKSVHAHAWRKIKDYHIAEEITQDAFLQAYKKLASLRNPDQFGGWICVITDRLCTAWLRKKKLYMQSLESVSNGVLEKTAYASYIAEQHEEEAAERRREIIESLMAMLPANERTAMVLYYLGEMSCEEVGKYLGVSTNTVKSRLSRARNRLKVVKFDAKPDILYQVGHDSISAKSRKSGRIRGVKSMRNNLVQEPTQWNLPETAKTRLGRGKIREIQYSPDGTILAVASSIGIWLYDMKTYQEIALLTEHPSQVSSVAFSPDGCTLASGSMDGTIHLWDIKTSSYKNILEPSDRTLSAFTVRAPSLAFSPDGKTLVCGYKKTIHIFNAITGELKNSLITDTSGVIKHIEFSQDSETIICGSISGEISLWDAITGKHKNTIPEPSNNEHAIAFNTIGQTYAVSNVISEQDCGIYINDLNTGELKNKLTGHSMRVVCLAFNPSDDTIATSTEEGIYLWDAHTGKHRFTLNDDSPDMEFRSDLEFSPDGKTLASERCDGIIRFWDAHTGNPKYDTFNGHNGFTESFAFTSNGKTVTITYGYGTIRIWDTNTGHLIKTHNEFRDPMLNGEIQNLTCISDGKILAWGAGGESDESHMQLWDTGTGEHINLPTKYEWNSHSLGLSTVGNTLAIALEDNLLRLCDMFTGEEKFVLSSPNKDIFDIAFSPDSKIVAATSIEDDAIPIWDTDTGELKHLLDLDSALRNDIADWRIDSGWCGLAFSPDGKTLACGGGEIIFLWDIDTGDNTKRLIRPTHRVFDLAFSPDGKTLASGGFESNINLWDPHTGEHIKTLTGHTAWVRSIAFSPDGKFLGSRSDDGTVLLWDMTQIQPQND